MAQYVTTIELREAPADIATSRIFKFNVIHQTPAIDAILKRHAIMIMSGYLKAARIKKGMPDRDTALIDLVCNLLVKQSTGHRDDSRVMLRKLFSRTVTNELQIKRLVNTCMPESLPHQSHKFTQVDWRTADADKSDQQWDKDEDEEDLKPTTSPPPRKPKPPQRRNRSGDDLDRAAGLVNWQTR